MTDAVSLLLVERRRPEAGRVQSVVVATAGHALVALALVMPAARAPFPRLEVATVIPLPMGEPSGVGGGSGGGAVSAPRLLKAGSMRHREELPGPSAPVLQRREVVAAAGAIGNLPDSVGAGSGPRLGVLSGDASASSWYLSGVQAKIWSAWASQSAGAVRAQPVVEFVIASDGSVSSIVLVETSGVAAVDMAAKRAVYSAQPFAPLPRDVASGTLRVRAVFNVGS